MIRMPVIPKLPDIPQLVLGRIDGGVSYKYNEMQLNNNQSPYMTDLNADDNGALTKRGGQEVVEEFASAPIHAIIYYDSVWVVAHSTKLSKYDPATDTETELLSGLANAKGVFFVMNGILYYLNGTDYIQYNGTMAAAVVGYIPTLATAVPPAGGGTVYEDVNYLQPAFKTSFSPTGSASTFQLPLTNLDATTVTATYGGATKTEGTHFTVDHTTGIVNTAGGTSPLGALAAGVDTFVVTAYKTVSGYADRIKNCKYATLYGQGNDLRAFICGDSSYKNRWYRSGSNDPTYFPENGFNAVGSDKEALTGFGIVYDTLINVKERSLHYTKYTTDDSGNVSFPTKMLNATIGCDMPYTIQLIDNNLVFCNTYLGAHILLSSDVPDERNVKPISSNINGSQNREGLLDEDDADLVLATSYDFEGKYYLCVGNKAWVWDYRLTPYNGNDEVLAWFYYTNINANCWYDQDRVLYYGDRTTANLVKMIGSFQDFGAAIYGVWRSKLFDFDLPNWLKTVNEMWFTTRANANSTVSVIYYDDSGTTVGSVTLPRSSTGGFDWSFFSWDSFTWAVRRYAHVIKLKPKLKKIKYFQVEFSNNELDQNLSLLNLTINFYPVKRVK